jgi:hypothetical protein
MAVNEKISGNLTIDGYILGGGIVPTVTSQNYLPVLRANPNPQMESSGFYYLDSTSTGRLYHDALIPQSGFIESNFILDTDNGIVKIGATPYGWPYPVVGFSANLNGFGINGGGSPYGPSIENSYGNLYLRDGYGSGIIQLSGGSVGINANDGYANLNGFYGASMGSGMGSSSIYGYDVFLSPNNNLSIYASNIWYASSSLYFTGTKTQTTKYLRILDDSQQEYFLPLYQ